MLLVGEGRDMFKTLESAIQRAIPGDVIEIRTNRPLGVKNASLMRDQHASQVKLKIRAGKGFEPVLRAVAINQPVITCSNADLDIEGIHFTSAFSTMFLVANDGNLTVRRCSFTSLPHQGTGCMCIAVFCANSTTDNTAEILFDRCVLRRCKAVGLKGKKIEVTIRGSGCAYPGMFTLEGAGQENDHVVRLQQSTFLQARLLQASITDSWPESPLVFEMHQCILAHVGSCCPTIINLHLTAAYEPKSLEGRIAAMRRYVSVFDVADSIGEFWGWWAHVEIDGDPADMISSEVFPKFLTGDTIRFGDRIRRIAEIPNTLESQILIASLVPQDFAADSDGPLGASLRRGVRIGCDPSQLPIPPDTSVQPYTILE